MQSHIEFYQNLLQTHGDDELRALVDKRLDELNSKYSEDITVGQEYTETYDGFLSDSTHYKAGAKMGNRDIADLVYDNKDIYYQFAKIIKDRPRQLFDENGCMSDITVFDNVFWHILHELPSQGQDSMIDRGWTFMGKKSTDKVSINQFIKQKCCVCADIAGQVQNLMLLLGIPCELACGAFWESPNNTGPHAYNIVHPFGKDGKTHFIFDATR